MRLYDVYLTQNNVYLIMEMCDGGDLRSFMKKFKGNPMSEI